MGWTASTESRAGESFLNLTSRSQAQDHKWKALLLLDGRTSSLGAGSFYLSDEDLPTAAVSCLSETRVKKA